MPVGPARVQWGATRAFEPDAGHEHRQLRGKDLAEAAFYPAELVHAIVRGMHLTHGADLMKSLINDKCDPADPKCLCSASRIRGYETESQQSARRK